MLVLATFCSIVMKWEHNYIVFILKSNWILLKLVLLSCTDSCENTNTTTSPEGNIGKWFQQYSDNWIEFLQPNSPVSLFCGQGRSNVIENLLFVLKRFWIKQIVYKILDPIVLEALFTQTSIRAVFMRSYMPRDYRFNVKGCLSLWNVT